VAAAVLIRQPVLTSLSYPGTTHADPAALRRHVEALAAHRHSEYIANAFRAAGAQVTEQPFTARKKTYRNVIATLGHGDPLIVVGAHYDAYDDLPGADDNASGAAGLIHWGGCWRIRAPHLPR
jgi:Peptidase family M28